MRRRRQRRGVPAGAQGRGDDPLVKHIGKVVAPFGFGREAVLLPFLAVSEDRDIIGPHAEAEWNHHHGDA
jgi:hypothetical protein